MAGPRSASQIAIHLRCTLYRLLMSHILQRDRIVPCRLGEATTEEVDWHAPEHEVCSSSNDHKLFSQLYWLLREIY